MAIGVKETRPKTDEYLNLCKRVTFGIKNIIKIKPARTMVIPMYLCRQESAARTESKKSTDHLFSYKNFAR